MERGAKFKYNMKIYSSHLINASIALIMLCPIATGLLSCSSAVPEVQHIDIEPLLNTKQYDEAETILKRALAESPKHPDILYNLAVVQRLQNRIREAKTTAQKALGISPSDDDILLLMTELNLDSGQIEEALNLFNRMSESARKKARAQRVYGIIQSQLNNWIEAEGHFRAALSLNKNDLSAKAALALALIKQGRVEDAKKHLESINPNQNVSSDTLYQTAECYLTMGNAQKALQLAETLIQQRPDDAKTWSLVGRAEMILMRFGESESAFTRALAAPNATIWHKLQYAEMLFAAQRENEALTLATEIEDEINDQGIILRDPTLNNLLATLYARRGQLLLANKYLKESLMIDPKQPKVRQLIKQITELEQGAPTPAPTQSQ